MPDCDPSPNPPDLSIVTPASNPDLSIVIPAYNEAGRLPKTLERVRAWSASYPSTEVLVVDDGSRDGTAAAVERIAATWPSLRLLRNPGNRGKGFSVRNGVLSAGGKTVLFTDADLSAPIDEAGKLLEALDGGYDVAIGSRGLRPDLIGVHQSFFRERAGKTFNILARALTGLPFKDTQCGFKAFRREAARAAFQPQQIPGFGFDVEALYLARKFGFRIAEVPVRWDHVEGTKVSMFGDSLRMFLDLLRVRWYDYQGKYRPFSASAGASP